MQAVDAAEADAYWCLCKLLDGIQDHYTHAQPGIQRTVFRLKELVRWPMVQPLVVGSLLSSPVMRLVSFSFLCPTHASLMLCTPWGTGAYRVPC